MVKKTQRLFVMTTVLILFVVFMGITSVVYVSTYARESQQVKHILDSLAGTPFNNHPGMPSNSMRVGKSFIVKLDHQYRMTETHYDQNFYTEASVLSIVSTALEENKPSSHVGGVYYGYFQTPSGFTIVGVDRTSELAINQSNMTTIVVVQLIGLIALSLIAWLLSFYIIKPIKVSIEKQQSFVSDASHELKTPLAIITSNVEVIKNDYGNSQWIENVIDQIEHMNHLIKSLLTLSAVEENKQALILTTLNLSAILLKELLSFEAIVYEANKDISYHLEENIMVNGHQDSIKQLIGILMDNAIKHSNTNGNIRVTLRKTRKTEIIFYNSGSDISNEQKEHIYNRFFKANSARTQNQSFGLGLAIAKSLCDKLGYHILFESEYQVYTQFTIVLP